MTGRIKDSVRWNRARILSYNAMLNMVVGARGVGKSYQGKDYAISLWVKQRQTTKWVMRYKTELERALLANDFLGGLYDPWKKRGYDLRYDADGCYCAPAGSDDWAQFMTFNTMSERGLKGAEDPSCGLIVFDEFIPIPGTPYIKDEVTRFLEYVSTIIRDRPARLMLFANNVTPISPYFSFFHVKLPRKGGFYYDAQRSVVVENVRNDEFERAMKSTDFGRLVAGTTYEAYAIENNSLIDLHTFVAPFPKNARPMVKISTEHGMLWLYVASPGLLFVHRSGPPHIPTFAMDDSSHKEDTVRGDYAGSLARNLLKSHHQRSALFFTSDTAKAIFQQSCQKLLK